ncbi:hypothetical protein AOLI_G00070060 [Acnodon oligacanthus]
MRSNHSTTRSSLFSRASLISCVTTPACSKHPGTFGIPPFWTEVSIYEFLRRNPHPFCKPPLLSNLSPPPYDLQDFPEPVE